MGKLSLKVPEWLKPLPYDQRVVVTPWYAVKTPLVVAGDGRTPYWVATGASSGAYSVLEETSEEKKPLNQKPLTRYYQAAPLH